MNKMDFGYKRDPNGHILFKKEEVICVTPLLNNNLEFAETMIGKKIRY